MGLFSRKVEVTLIDDRSGAVMAVTRLKPDALPASFFTSTTMHLGDANWSVVSAAPMTRAEYTKAGKLVLRLRPVELIDPKELLFSLPTICDQLPASDGAEADGTEVALRDDDWRQFELVSETLLPILETEINAVWAIHQSARVGVGFQKVHVRSGLPQPIDDKTVPFADVQRLAGERLCLPLRFDGAGRMDSRFTSTSSMFSTAYAPVRPWRSWDSTRAPLLEWPVSRISLPDVGCWPSTGAAAWPPVPA